MSSSSVNKYIHHQVMIMVVAVMLAGVPTTSAAISGYCNAESFPDGDQRIQCVFTLIDKLVGPEFPVKKGGWYETEDCADGSILYGFRWAEEGASGCLYEAKYYIQNQNCYHRIGAQAWDAGCYMRFEVYEFYSGYV